MTTRHTLRNALIALCTVPALVLLPFHAAQAAPPSNDDVGDATVIPALPFTDQVNTTEATAEPDDLDCFGNLNSVWYSFTPTEDVDVLVDTFGSNYDTTLCVYAGTPAPATRIAIDDDSGGTAQSVVVFGADEGMTYYIMAGSFFDGGGDLMLNAEVGPPPLEIDVDVDDSGSFDPKTGLATISGTVTCNRPVYLDLWGELRQKALGHLWVDAEFYTYFEVCDGEMEWSMIVESDEGLFKGGQAVVEGEACGGDDLEWLCVEFEEAVSLKGKK